MSEMNARKLNYIAEYVRTQEEFPFDLLDVEENLDGILGYYGFFPALDESDRYELRKAFDEIAEDAEWAEMARLVGEAEHQALGWVDPSIEYKWVDIMNRRKAKSVTMEEWLKTVLAR